MPAAELGALSSALECHGSVSRRPWLARAGSNASASRRHVMTKGTHHQLEAQQVHEERPPEKGEGKRLGKRSG